MLALPSPFNLTYCYMDYSLNRKVICRRAHMEGPRDRKKQFYSTLRLLFLQILKQAPFHLTN